MSFFWRLFPSRPIFSALQASRKLPRSVALQRSLYNGEITPLNIALPNVPPSPSALAEQVEWTREHHETHVSTLENGIRVASEESFGQFSTVGVIIDGGSRYEVDYPHGMTHVLEKLAFQSTAKFANHDDIMQELEQVGGMADCTSFRDAIVYGASSFTSGLPLAVEVLSEAVIMPQVTQQEVEEQKMLVQFELENLELRLDPEPILTDMIHAAAFRNNTLGLPKLCPPDSLPQITKETILQYMQTYYKPERMVVAGVNVDHEQLVELTRKFFLSQKPSWQAKGVVLTPPDNSVAQYTGGIVTEHLSEPRVNPGPTPLPELSHISIGLESTSYDDPDFFAFTVLNMLMGGGGSFSAGGPGKGMYSRLYLNVLNKHHWIYSATAYNHSYSDSGLFCIHASSHPSQLRDLVQVITREFFSLIKGLISEVELTRAKKQLQSMLMMNLESRIVVFEDIGRQVLGIGERKSAKELYDLIENVTMDDVIRVSSRMLGTKPSVAAIGNLSFMPKYDDIQEAFAQKGALAGSSRFFLPFRTR